jgi:mono/diheme cytochrome c family protein
MNRISIIAGSLLFAATLAASGQEAGKIDLSKLPPAATKSPITFAADIKPIFDKSCVRCHGAEKPKGRLRLDSLAGTLKGSEHGAVLKAGKSTESKLVLAVARIGADPDEHMPPLRNKAGIEPLTAEQAGLIRAWVDQGAK